MARGGAGRAGPTLRGIQLPSARARRLARHNHALPNNTLATTYLDSELTTAARPAPRAARPSPIILL